MCIGDKLGANAYEKAKETRHARVFFGLKELPLKEVLDDYRNYFCHLVYDKGFPKHMQDKNIQDIYERVLRESLHKILYAEKPQLARKRQDGKERKEEAMRQDHDVIHRHLESAFHKPSYLFDWQDKKQQQICLALLLAPFLTRSQLAFLWGKIWLAGESKDQEESHVSQARRRVLNRMALADSAVAIQPQEQDRLFTHGQEQGLAILVRLKDTLDKPDVMAPEDGSVPSFPEDAWFMKQMILFLENTKALPSVRFARTRTEKDADNKTLKQERIFSSEQGNPLQIRVNTLSAQVGEDKSHKAHGMFGLNVLKYLVCAVLKGQEINSFIEEWHKDKPRWRGGRGRGHEKTGDVSLQKLENRIDFHKQTLSQKPRSLQPRIRFITQAINQAYYEKHDEYMNEHDYKLMEENVRFYRRRALQVTLEEQDLFRHKVPMTNKTFGQLLAKGRLEDVYQDFTRARIEWLEQQKKHLSELDADSRLTLGYQLGVRGLPSRLQEQSDEKFSAPLGITAEEVRDQFFKGFFTYRSEHDMQGFAGLVHSLKQGDSVPSHKFGVTEKGDGMNKKESRRMRMKRRERWTRACLLYAMARHLLRDMVNFERFNLKGFKPSSLPITVDLRHDMKIHCTLTQGWRAYAHWDKEKKLKYLIEAYVPKDLWGRLPLLREGETLPQDKKIDSVQAAQAALERERFWAVQAVLEWEKMIVDDKKEGLKKEPEDYITFTTVVGAADLEETKKKVLERYRDCALHGNVWYNENKDKGPKYGGKRFSDAPEPIGTLYRKIQEKATHRRDEQKRQGQKRHFPHKKKPYAQRTKRH